MKAFLLGGVVELDHRGLVTSFIEEPRDPAADLANAGICAFDPSALDEIAAPPPPDPAYDLSPRLVGRAYGIPVAGYFRDIGTLDAYQRA